MGGAENAERVRRLFETWKVEGLEAFLSMVPSGVEWHPRAGRGRRLWDADDLRAFWETLRERGETLEAELSDVEALDGDNVLATATVRSRQPEGRVFIETTVWLCSFRDGRLWRASRHESLAEAREAARFLHTDRIAVARTGPNFQATRHQEPGGRTVLELSGELDFGSADELAAAIERAAASGHVLVDLRGLKFMDSSGLRALLEAARRASEDGWRLELRRGSDVVQRVITMTGAERLLPFEPA